MGGCAAVERSVPGELVLREPPAGIEDVDPMGMGAAPFPEDQICIATIGSDGETGNENARHAFERKTVIDRP